MPRGEESKEKNKKCRPVGIQPPPQETRFSTKKQAGICRVNRALFMAVPENSIILRCRIHRQMMLSGMYRALLAFTVNTVVGPEGDSFLFLY